MRKRHYLRMSCDDICNDRCVKRFLNLMLFYTLWYQHIRHIRESLSVMDAWGFEYKSQYVWVKDKIGMGYWVRGQHELLLIGKKGRFRCPDPDKRRSSVINAPRGKHSQKPNCVRDMLSDMFPHHDKIELFARERFAGWDAWGNEV